MEKERLLHLKDMMQPEDSMNVQINEAGKVSVKHPSPYNRTRILGISDLGETLFDVENQVVLGGALFTLEKVFGAKSPLKVEYLNNIMNIATTGTAVTDIYPKENVVCLFGVGTGGCGDSYKTVKDVKFYEREIFEMIPFRLSSNTLPVGIKDKYWFRKASAGKTAHYLKTFESAPQIKVLWKDAEGEEDGSEVREGVHNTPRTEQIETFIEIILRIDKDDIREHFNNTGNIENARVNSIGLFTGVKSQLADGTQDYKQVKMFSKLNIPNEILTIAKSFTMIYRIYTS